MLRKRKHRCDVSGKSSGESSPVSGPARVVREFDAQTSPVCLLQLFGEHQQEKEDL